VAVKDYAIFMLDPEGKIVTWNEGAKRIKGYEEHEIVGKHVSVFYPKEDIESGNLVRQLEEAKNNGSYEEEGIRVRKDGTNFVAHVLITAIYDDQKGLRGYSKVTRDISEKKIAEKNLSETESRYRQMIETVQDYAIFRLDPEGRILTWNEGARRLKGYEAAEIIGKHFSVFYPPDLQAEKFPDYELKVAAKDGKFEHEGWRIRKDGSKFWASVVISRLADGEGNLLGFTKVTRDLTERKRAEEMMASLARTFDTALSASPAFHFIVDIGNRLTYANRAFLAYINKTSEEVIGKSINEIGYDQIVVEKLLEEFKKVKSAVKVEGEYTQQIVSGDTTEYVYTLVPILDADHNVQSISGTIQDVTELRRLERVRMNESLLRAFADTISQMAWIAEANGNIFWYNKRWHEFTGTTLEEVKDWGWQCVHHPEYLPKVTEKWKYSIAQKIPFNMEFPIRSKDGTYRMFHTVANPIKDENGQVLRWIGTNSDIDELKKNQIELSRALQVRDEFFSIASHELKTPLTSLKLHLQVAERNGKKKPDQTSIHQLVESITHGLKQVDNLTGLVDDLLDTTRIQTGNFSLSKSKINLSQLLKEIATRFSNQLAASKTELSLNLDENAFGYWDRQRLSQVFSNFFSNAIKYAPSAPLSVSTKLHKDCVSICFEDKGPGIPEESQTKIFERFERANRNKNVVGLGLGLFIVKKIIEAHNGTITLESKEGFGTKFLIVIPLGNENITEEMMDHHAQ
jgi:PAS domain S-box-containing protein